MISTPDHSHVAFLVEVAMVVLDRAIGVVPTVGQGALGQPHLVFPTDQRTTQSHVG